MSFFQKSLFVINSFSKEEEEEKSMIKAQRMLKERDEERKIMMMDSRVLFPRTLQN